LMMLESHPCRKIFVSVQTNVGQINVHYLWQIIEFKVLAKVSRWKMKIKIPRSQILWRTTISWCHFCCILIASTYAYVHTHLFQNECLDRKSHTAGWKYPAVTCTYKVVRIIWAPVPRKKFMMHSRLYDAYVFSESLKLYICLCEHSSKLSVPITFCDCNLTCAFWCLLSAPRWWWTSRIERIDN
jgi:hypothetical protein